MADTDKLNIDSIIARLLEGKYYGHRLCIVFRSALSLIFLGSGQKRECVNVKRTIVLLQLFI